MYKIISEKMVKRILDNAFIPFDLSNADYQEYLKWIAEGNVPEPADEIVISNISKPADE